MALLVTTQWRWTFLTDSTRRHSRPVHRTLLDDRYAQASSLRSLDLLMLKLEGPSIPKVHCSQQPWAAIASTVSNLKKKCGAVVNRTRVERNSRCCRRRRRRQRRVNDLLLSLDVLALCARIATAIERTCPARLLVSQRWSWSGKLCMSVSQVTTGLGSNSVLRMQMCSTGSSTGQCVCDSCLPSSLTPFGGLQEGNRELLQLPDETLPNSQEQELSIRRVWVREKG